MSHYELITSQAVLQDRLPQMTSAPVLALDTEASSFHRYKERMCLVQISDRDRTWLIDPLAIPELTALGNLLSDPKKEVVIHDADYDLRILARDHGIRVEHIFDTLIAAELVNEPEIGLAALLRKHLGVEVDKKFQKADWSRRPLPIPMLDYAAGDTDHLIALRDILKQRLNQLGRWDWAMEEFGLLTNAPFERSADTEPAFMRIMGARVLKPQQLAVLSAVHAWREGVAARMDRAPFMVLGNEALIMLATDPPVRTSDLKGRKGMSDKVVQRHGVDLLAAVERGRAMPREEWPRISKPKKWQRDEGYEDRLKRLKRTRDRLTLAHDLRPGIVASNQLLMDMARTLPGDLQALGALPGMRRYQVKHFGEDLLRVLDDERS